MTQLAIDFAAPPSAAAPIDARWVYERGMPDREGMAAYTHLLRSKSDAKETKERGGSSRKPGWQNALGTPEEWRAKIVALLADGKPRTFNTICVELIGTTSDVLYETAVDGGLWLACERGEIAWSNQDAVWWVDARVIAWPVAA